MTNNPDLTNPRDAMFGSQPAQCRTVDRDIPAVLSAAQIGTLKIMLHLVHHLDVLIFKLTSCAKYMII